MNDNLESRIETMLSGRKIHTWGAEIGLSRGIINNLNKGKLPGSDKLGPIIRSENLSITWFLEGIGSPYLVVHCISDDDCYTTLDELYAEKWTTHLITDGIQIAIVLSSLGSYQVGNVDYVYTPIEVLAGNIGPKALDRVSDTADGYNIYYAETSSGVMAQLLKGQMGTYRLLKADNAVLKNADLIKSNESPEFKQYQKCAEDRVQYQGGGKISSDEMATVEEMRLLDPKNLTHIRAVIRSLAEQADKNEQSK